MHGNDDTPCCTHAGPAGTAWMADADVLTAEARLLHPNLPLGGDNTPLRPDQTEEAQRRCERLFSALHRLPADEAPAALCLSGGGIRSATFGLGVLQGLARRQLLERFHYLSTVSGGGYIGSWLSAWIAQAQQREERRRADLDLPAPPPDHGRRQVLGELAAGGQGQPREPEPLRQLRAYSSYLSPVRGLSADALTLLAIYLRNLTLNWLVLLPMLAALLLLPRLHLAVLACATVPAWLPPAAAGLATLLVVWTIGFMAYDLPAPARSAAPDARPPPEPPRGWLRHPVTLAAPLLLAAVLLTWVLGWQDSAARAAPMPHAWLAAGLPAWLTDLAAHGAVLPFVAAGAVLHVLAAFVGGALRHLRRGQDAGRGGQSLRWLLRTGLGLVASGAVGGVALGALATGYLGHGERQARDLAAQTAKATAEVSRAEAARWSALRMDVAPPAATPRSTTPPPARPAPAAPAASDAELAVHQALTQLDLVKVAAERARASRRTWLAMGGVPLLLLAFWLGVTLYAGLHRRDGDEGEREWWARSAAMWLGSALAWLALAATVLLLPGWLLSLPWLQKPSAPGVAGVLTTLLGLGSAAAGYLSKEGPALQQRAQSLASALGMRLVDLAATLFIVALLLVVSYGTTCTLRALPVDAAALMQTAAQQSDVAVQALARQQALAKAADEARERGRPARPVTCGEACASLAALAEGRYERGLHSASVCLLFGALVMAVGFGLALSAFVGANAFSLHNLYGNRLVRAYLGASRSQAERRPNWLTGFDPRDNLPLSQLVPDLRPRCGASPAAGGAAAPVPAPRLFPVINTALNLVAPAGSRLEWQDRKATGFTMSPLACGSPLTGHVRSADFAGTPHWRPCNAHAGPMARQQAAGGVSLGQALTISGAAASPNMGYHSSTPLALVMTLFDIRLGAWLPNPGWRNDPPQALSMLWRRSEPTIGLGPLLTEALGLTSDQHRFVNLSDGGHFENLGLYEMVRRRCRRIVLVDATCDPLYQYGDLEGALRKIRIDLGIEIDFPEGLPGPPAAGGNGRHMAAGRIHYHLADTLTGDGTARPGDGVLYLIKPMLSGDEPLDLKRYAATSAKKDAVFPQQATSDQFYDEAQFESYRLLGLHSVLATFGGPPGQWPAVAADDPAVAEAATALARRRAAVAAATAGGATATAAAATGGRAVASGVAEQLRSHAGTIAASALVSTVALTGVVTLSNPEVRLANTELRLAPTDLPAPVASAPTSGASQPGPTATLDPALIDRLEAQLGRVAQQADAAASGLASVGQALPPAASAVSGLGGSARVADAAAARLAERFNQLKPVAASTPPPAASEVTLRLRKDVEEAIVRTATHTDRTASGVESLNSGVGTLPPRRNARGAAEGTNR